MTTVRDICTRALRRNNVTASGEVPTDTEASDALDALNDMMHAWSYEGVNIPHVDFTLNDNFQFFVPPEIRAPFDPLFMSSEALSVAAYQGTWNASANSPALLTSTGTKGHLYKVATAGSTTIDATTTWAVDDYLIFNGKQWVKGRSSRPFESAVIALLAVRLTTEFGDEATPELAMAATDGWNRILIPWATPDLAEFGFGLTSTFVHRWR